MNPGTAELAALFPAPRSVTIAGRTIEIKRCGIAQGGRIIDAGQGLYQRIQDGAEFLDLFEQFPEETTALIVAATGLDTEWVTGLTPVDQFDLASVWMEVNAAFFAQRLLPSLARYLGAVQAIGRGPTSSTASLPQDTSTPATTPSMPHPSTLPPSPAPNGAIGMAA